MLRLLSRKIVNTCLGLRVPHYRYFSDKNKKIISFPLADIGEGMSEARISSWYIKEGDKVAQFDPICQVESDKATVDITSRYDGIIAKLHYVAGENARVGSALIDIFVEEDFLAIEAPKQTLQKPESPEPSKIDLKVNLSNNINIINNNKVLAVPSVRALASRLNVDIANIIGSGPDGRIMRNDVENASIQVTNNDSCNLNTIDPQTLIKDHEIVKTTISSNFTQVDLSSVQRAMFKAMTRSLDVPTFVYCDEADIQQLEIARKQLKHASYMENTPIPSILCYIIKAMSLALKHYPQLNSHFMVENTTNTQNQLSQQKLNQFKSHNIGVAIDSPAGLVVPCIHGVEKLSVLEISSELSRLRVAAKKGKIHPDDLRATTITLSNIGAIGGTYMTPIVTPPQVCIIALGRSEWVKKYIECKGDENDYATISGQPKLIKIKQKIMPMSLSADHRVIDGATAAKFISLWKEYMSHPQIALGELA